MKYLFLASVLLLGCSNDGTEILTPDAGLRSDKDAGIPPNYFAAAPEHFQIKYHGGPIMTAPVNVYFIWYGDWSNHSNTQEILTNLANNISNSDWFEITKQYSQPVSIGNDASTLLYPSNKVSLIKSINDNYSHGINLTTPDVEEIIAQSISQGDLPLDDDGVYFLLSSSDVSQTDRDTTQFCTGFCGFHFDFVRFEKDLKYVFIGDPSQCLGSCSLQSVYHHFKYELSPNDNWAADSMADTFAHELSESITDPSGSLSPAWYDDLGFENADKCQWTYGSVYLTNNNSLANMIIGNRNYMIQQNWILDGDNSHCGIHL